MFLCCVCARISFFQIPAGSKNCWTCLSRSNWSGNQMCLNQWWPRGSSYTYMNELSSDSYHTNSCTHAKTRSSIYEKQATMSEWVDIQINYSIFLWQKRDFNTTHTWVEKVETLNCWTLGQESIQEVVMHAVHDKVDRFAVIKNVVDFHNWA